MVENVNVVIVSRAETSDESTVFASSTLDSITRGMY